VGDADGPAEPPTIAVADADGTAVGSIPPVDAWGLGAFVGRGPGVARPDGAVVDTGEGFGPAVVPGEGVAAPAGAASSTDTSNGIRTARGTETAHSRAGRGYTPGS
jgi:hypothetical protein